MTYLALSAIKSTYKSKLFCKQFLKQTLKMCCVYCNDHFRINYKSVWNIIYVIENSKGKQCYQHIICINPFYHLIKNVLIEQNVYSLRKLTVLVYMDHTMYIWI